MCPVQLSSHIYAYHDTVAAQETRENKIKGYMKQFVDSFEHKDPELIRVADMFGLHEFAQSMQLAEISDRS